MKSKSTKIRILKKLNYTVNKNKNILKAKNTE